MPLVDGSAASRPSFRRSRMSGWLVGVEKKPCVVVSWKRLICVSGWERG